MYSTNGVYMQYVIYDNSIDNDNENYNYDNIDNDENFGDDRNNES